jgi:hypothetical protein
MLRQRNISASSNCALTFNLPTFIHGDDGRGIVAGVISWRKSSKLPGGGHCKIPRPTIARGARHLSNRNVMTFREKLVFQEFLPG